MVTLLLNKLGGVNFEDRGDKTHISEEESQTWEAMLRTAILVAENAVRTLQADNVYENGPNIVVDEFTDDDGTNGTINTGSSTATYNSTLKRYQPTTTAGTAESSTSITTQDGNSTSLTISVTPKSATGFINQVQVENSGNNTGNTFTVNIKKSSNTIATISQAGGLSGANSTFTFTKDDYIEFIDSGDIITVDIILSSGGFYTLTSQSYSGTDFDLSSQTLPGATTSVTPIQFTDVSITTGAVTVIVDTDTTTLTGDELGFAISTPESVIQTGTTLTATVSDGSNSLSAVSINSTSKGVVTGNDGSLSSGTLKVTYTLTPTSSKMVSISEYGVCILR